MPSFIPDWVRVPRGSRFLVTGSAGFIGSALVEALVLDGFFVRGLDDMSTGKQENLDELAALPGAGAGYEFILGDIRNLDTCRAAMDGIDYVLHQAALGSVPRSIEDPITSDQVNVGGTLNVFVAARDAGVKRVVYAASSATYGDEPTLPKVEERIGRPLSPYAVTKHVNELYAQVFATCYGLSTVGLRYFNVFGRRQDPDSAYAAVMPLFVSALLKGQAPTIHGDGEQSRDFTYIDNVVQANLLAATAPEASANTVYNVACGERVTLNVLYRELRGLLAPHLPQVAELSPVYGPPRPGDVRHSQADIGKIRKGLGYRVTDDVAGGLAKAIDWYRTHL
ncbi:MAG: SDR family oxidoreductase [Nitrospirae bacterium]|nr:SDR family oxidoreductase [Nitrospirota bacterium]